MVRYAKKEFAMTLIIVIILGILITYYLYKIPREEAEEKELRREQPVMIELIPKGTKANPVKCIINDTIYFRVMGYSDYKMENLIELEGSNIMWHKIPQGGMWEKDFGIENTYTAPSVKGYFDVYVKYKDKKLITSSKAKILVEV